MKKMKKLLVFLLAAVMVLPFAAAPSKAKAAELTAAELLAKAEESQKTLKSYDESFSMDFGIKMKGMGQLANIKFEGTSTEFVSDGNPVKAKAAVEMDLTFGKTVKPMLEQSGIKAGTYKSESYVISSDKGMDIYAMADVPSGEGLKWTKTSITQEQIAALLVQYGINESTSPTTSVSDFVDGFTVKEEENTYVVEGEIAITKKMISDNVKQTGQLDKMSKKEKKEFKKTLNKLTKNLKPIEVSMVVDKETFVPLSQTVDFNAYTNGIVKAALKMDKKDKESVKMSKQITITGCIIKTELSNINSAADFTIPKEAESAEVIPFEELIGSVSGLE